MESKYVWFAVKVNIVFALYMWLIDNPFDYLNIFYIIETPNVFLTIVLSLVHVFVSQIPVFIVFRFVYKNSAEDKLLLNQSIIYTIILQIVVSLIYTNLAYDTIPVLAVFVVLVLNSGLSYFTFHLAGINYQTKSIGDSVNKNPPEIRH